MFRQLYLHRLLAEQYHAINECHFQAFYKIPLMLFIPSYVGNKFGVIMYRLQCSYS